VAEALAKLFATISTHKHLSTAGGRYSASGVVHSIGRSKWIVEATYVGRRRTAQVHIGWVVQIYNASEALPNLVNRSGCCNPGDFEKN